MIEFEAYMDAIRVKPRPLRVRQLEKLFGYPVEIDPTIPVNEIRLEPVIGKVKIANA